MFNSARQAAKAYLLKSNDSDDDKLIVQDIPSESLPKSCTLEQIQYELFRSDETSSRNTALENLLILTSCSLHRCFEHEDDQKFVPISLWIARNILPDSSIISLDHPPSDSKAAEIERARRSTQRLGNLGLGFLRTLYTSSEPPLMTPDERVFLSAIAFSSSRDQWTTTASVRSATAILSCYAKQVQSSEFVIEFLIQRIIRPLFSKSKPAAVTSTGRKALPSSAPRNFDATADSNPANKPWKYISPYSITVLEWAVSNSSDEIMIKNWNLFIPPLLTLLDSQTTHIRSRGLEILSIFLPKMGTKLLVQTGLGEVFEDAVRPTLMYLPAVTPLGESLQLLPPAYQAIFVLGDIWYATRDGEKLEQKENNEKDKMKFYDRVMRGHLEGYQHAQEYSAIVEILLYQLAILINKMGVHGVKHLKDIIPIISTTLTDPFLPTTLSPPSKQKGTPNLLLAALAALKAVILNCWPRISQPVHRILILRSLVGCWMNVSESMRDPTDNAQSLEEAREALKEVGRLFVLAVSSTQEDGNGGILIEVGMAIDAAEGDGLRELFGTKL